MKFSLLTLGALAFSAQQASLVRGEGDNTSGQQAKDGVCNPNSSLSFNITRAGESVLFTCSETVSNLDPAFSDTIPEMYEGNSKVRILEFLPGATLQKVETTGESRSSG
ncbi:SAG-related sequence SRS22I, partial [Toxoplasma gondii VAND]